jgi:hypothetical protein
MSMHAAPAVWRPLLAPPGRAEWLPAGGIAGWRPPLPGRRRALCNLLLRCACRRHACRPQHGALSGADPPDEPGQGHNQVGAAPGQRAAGPRQKLQGSGLPAMPPPCRLRPARALVC